MIRNIEIINPATKKDSDTYNKICDILGFDKELKIRKENFKIFPDNFPIHSIKMFYLDYENWGRMYFICPTINIPAMFNKYGNNSNLNYEMFIKLLKKLYADEFGEELAKKLIDPCKMVCSYVEYVALLKVDNADDIVENLRKYKFTSEQLDVNKFDEYRLKNAYVTFTINPMDYNTIRLCAKCPNTALKKLTKITGLENLQADKAFDIEFASTLLENQAKKFTKPNKLDIFSKTSILKSFINDIH